MYTNEGEMQSLKSRRRNPQAIHRKRPNRHNRKKNLRLAIKIGIIVLGVAAFVGLLFWAARFAQNKSVEKSRITAKGDTFTIMLDAGHGGADTGLTNELLIEKEITLSIVSKLKIMLESYGYNVVLTRKDDSRISKESRVEAVNASDADLCVSIHLNYSENESACGVETYYKEDSGEGLLVAETVIDSVLAETNTVSNGVYTGNFAILNDTKIPSVMVQVGYASSAEDSELLAEDVFRNDMAKGIAKGIIRSLE